MSPTRSLGALSCLILSLLAVGISPGPAAADAQADKGFKLMAAESIGQLKLGLPADEVKKLLGPAPTVGEENLWEAIGDYVQEWRYPKLGLILQMGSPVPIKQTSSKQNILSISIEAPSTFKTKAGIQLGATEEQVRKAYGTAEDKESGEKGKLFVAGTVYGGLIFEFTKGKVSRIFLGAAAE